MTERQNIPYSTQHDRNRAKVSKLLGRRIGRPHEIHTHTDGTLVVCEDKSYHMLLHRRTDALKACGHADWRWCCICQEYDHPNNLSIHSRPGGSIRAYHLKCKRRYNRKRQLEIERRQTNAKI